MAVGLFGLLPWIGDPTGYKLAMPNPLETIGPQEYVSLSRDKLNRNFAGRHKLGRTVLTEAEDGYVVLDDDELLEFTITADTGAVLPDPSTCTGRSIYVFVATLGGFEVTLTADGAADINGASSLVLATEWTGGRLVARESDWIYLGGT